MKSLLPILTALLLLPNFCSSAASSAADQDFLALARLYTDEFLDRHPEHATSLGDHRFDDRLDDYSLAGKTRELSIARSYLAKLGKIDPARLTPQNRTDHGIFKDSLESTVLELESIRSYAWNPMNYNAANAIYHLVSREYAPLSQRLRSVKGRLQAITNITQNARLNLQNPPRLHTETAIQQNKGSIHLIKDELSQFIAQAPEVRAELAPVQAAAVKALEDFGQWLEKELLPRSNGDFRYGHEKFRARLRYSLGSTLSKEQVLQNAEAELTKTENDIYATAWPLYRRFFPGQSSTEPADSSGRKKIVKAVLDKLAEKHPTDQTIVDQARRDLVECTKFVAEHKIVSIPREPLEIIVMPEFKRGVAVAYCDAPGALAKNEATFFAISPTPADWSTQRKDSFYREYNDYMLKNLTVHEAMPGHYLQLIQGNRFQAPTKIRALFHSGIFAEGWATYTEQVMAEAGFGGPEVKMQQLKMRLRLIINAIIDQKIHTAGMTEKEAMDLMMNEIGRA